MNALQIVSTLGLAVVGGILYRLGGIGGAWWKNTKVRDFGVPAVALLLLAILGMKAAWWIWLATFVASFGVMTTYFKIGYQEDVHWYNWTLVGLFFGLCVIGFALATGNWLGFALRTGLLTVMVPVFCESVDRDWFEEGGRGAMFIISLPLLLI